MKKILLLSTIFFGFGLINAGKMNENEIREELMQLGEKERELKGKIDSVANYSLELQNKCQDIMNAAFDRCECAIRKGISDPEAGIECEEETRKIIDSYAKLRESNDGKLFIESITALCEVRKEKGALKAQLKKIEKGKQ